MRERKEKGDLETLKSNSLLSDEDVKLMILKVYACKYQIEPHYLLRVKMFKKLYG